MTQPSESAIAAAEAHARIAARAKLPVTTCPHDPASTDPAERVLAVRWVRAYRRAGGGPAVDYS